MLPSFVTAADVNMRDNNVYFVMNSELFIYKVTGGDEQNGYTYSFLHQCHLTENTADNPFRVISSSSPLSTPPPDLTAIMIQWDAKLMLAFSKRKLFVFRSQLGPDGDIQGGTWEYVGEVATPC